MAKIVNLNELVGEDIVFQYGTPVHDYAIPGDIPVETVFELFEMFSTVNEINEIDATKIVGAVKRKFDDINERLLPLFQQRDPNLEKLPFGIKGTGIVLRNVLAELGVNVDTGNPPAPAPSPRRRSATKKTSARRKKK